MKFKVKVADQICVPVDLTDKAIDGDVQIKFELVCKRQAVKQIEAGGKKTISETLQEVIVDWRNQSIVVDAETGEPVKFSKEALEALLEQPGFAMVAYVAYMQTNALSQTPEGKRKN